MAGLREPARIYGKEPLAPQDPRNRGREQFTPRYVSREFRKQHLGNYYRLATRHPDEHLVSGDRSRYFRADMVNGARVTALPVESAARTVGNAIQVLVRAKQATKQRADICGAFLLERR